MSATIKPAVGRWYMTATGQLIKVWASAYFDGRISRIAIEYLNGRKRLLTMDEWATLELEMHLYSEPAQGGDAVL